MRRIPRVVPPRSTLRTSSTIRTRGFTLIELLVAVGLMAVLALLSWRGLDTILQSRERLVVASDQLRSLTLAFSQMDEDLLRSWPVSQLKLNEPYLRVGVAGERNEQSIQLIREVNRTGLPTRVQRVVYQIRDGQLSRGFSEWGTASAGAGGTTGGGVGGAVQSLVWQPILSGVRAITVRGWIDGRGWLDASALAAVTGAAANLGQSTASGAQKAGTETVGGADAGSAAQAQAQTQAQAQAQAQARAAAQAAATALTIGGLEVMVERTDGQRYLRVFSVKD